MAFDGADSWSYGNDFARNAIIFGVKKSSSSDTYNLKLNFLVLSKERTDDIDGSVGTAEKKFSINFS